MKRSDEGDGTTPRVVIDFGESEEPARWVAVNDGVMGGRSTSRLVAGGQGSCIFSGTVSLENNGGFASVRTLPRELGLGGAGSLTLAYRGDGKIYKLRLRTDDAFDGVSYEASFPSMDGVRSQRSFAIEDFTPVWRGRPVPDAAPLTLERVRSIGFMIAGGQAGPFRLEVMSLARA